MEDAVAAAATDEVECNDSEAPLNIAQTTRSAASVSIPEAQEQQQQQLLQQQQTGGGDGGVGAGRGAESVSLLLKWAEIKAKFMPMAGPGAVLSDYTVLVNGEVISKRQHGKTLFLDVSPADKGSTGMAQLVFNLKWSASPQDVAAFIERVQVGDVVSIEGHPGRTRKGAGDDKGFSVFGAKAVIQAAKLSANRVVSLMTKLSDGKLAPKEAAQFLGTTVEFVAPLRELLATHVAKRVKDKDACERGQRRRELRKIRTAEADKEARKEAEAASSIRSAAVAAVATGAAGAVGAVGTAGAVAEDVSNTARDASGKGSAPYVVSPAAVPAATTKRLERMREVAARRQPNLYIVLEQPWNPGNVAAVMRSCDAFGVTELLLVDWKNGHPNSDTTLQKRSVSASLWVPSKLFSTSDQAAAYLEAKGVASYGTTVHSDKSAELFNVDFCTRHHPLTADAPPPTGSSIATSTPAHAGAAVPEASAPPPGVALWFGNELEGLSPRGHEICEHHVFIPMHGMVESHNLASSVAILLTEVTRQRWVHEKQAK